jgi:hypothetical protein
LLPTTQKNYWHCGQQHETFFPHCGQQRGKMFGVVGNNAEELLQRRLIFKKLSPHCKLLKEQ